MPEFYRGYIPSQADLSPKHDSGGINLDELFKSQGNPHKEQYAERLLWATPDKKYAACVAILRSLVKAALDDNYLAAAKNSNDKLPLIATYQIGDNDKYYDGEGESLAEPGEIDSLLQVVVQKVDPEDIHIEQIARDDYDRLLRVLDVTGKDDSVFRAILPLRDKYKKNYFDPNGPVNANARQMTVKELLKGAADFYQNLGASRFEVEDRLAEGIFAGSSFFRNLALSMHFSQIS
ncbi:MAG: hypothetical protein ABFQ62_03630 [Patescibacteria group bacterium]